MGGVAWLGVARRPVDSKSCGVPEIHESTQILASKGSTCLDPPQGLRHNRTTRPRLSTASAGRARATGALPTPPLRACLASAGMRRARTSTASYLRNTSASEHWADCAGGLGRGGAGLEVPMGSRAAEQASACQGPPGKFLPESRWLGGALVLHIPAWNARGLLLPDPTLHRRRSDRG